MKPYLIQRLLPRKDGSGRRGIDRFFSMDYMGSSEFEWGVLPESLKVWRTQTNTGPERIKTATGEVAWYVGPAEGFDVAKGFFIEQLTDPDKSLLKESTRIQQRYRGDEYYQDFVGWWDIQNHWAIFVKKAYAFSWLDGINNTNEKSNV